MWRKNFSHGTKNLKIYPCDLLSARHIAKIASIPSVAEPYFVGNYSNAIEMPRCAHWWQRCDDLVRLNTLNLAARNKYDEVVGFIQLLESRISYFVAPQAWGKGLGFEMAEAVCGHYAQLLNISTMHASVIRENNNSRRILEKVGFEFKGLDYRSWAGRRGVATMLKYQLR